jgi:hypothetical protein
MPPALDDQLNEGAKRRALPIEVRGCRASLSSQDLLIVAWKHSTLFAKCS